MALVSVIIPTHNRAELLLRAAKSVLAQTFGDWELIVVDDGSTDETKPVFRDWLAEAKPSQAVHFLKTKNLGVSHARNLGVEYARGEWVAFLDSDDEWLPQKLERQMNLSEEFEVIHSNELWRRDGKEVPQLKKHAKPASGRVFEACVPICCVATSTVLMKRRLFNGFREDFPVCEDFELWLRLSARHKFGLVGEPLVIKHGGRDDQLSTRFKAMDYFRVKALLPFLESAVLNTEEKNLVAENIVVKSDILLAGYQKHARFENFAEIKAARDQAGRLNPTTSSHQ